jgi:hypothetical protein
MLGLYDKGLLIHRAPLIWGEVERIPWICASTELTGEVVSTSPWVVGLFITTMARLAIRGHELHCQCMVTMSGRDTVREEQGTSDTAAEWPSHGEHRWNIPVRLWLSSRNHDTTQCYLPVVDPFPKSLEHIQFYSALDLCHRSLDIFGALIFSVLLNRPPFTLSLSWFLLRTW